MPAAPASGSQSTVVSAPPATSSIDGDNFTRLHITPLDADLLKVIVPPSALPRARNISYHTIETFPENRYGFVELPKTDADKIKTKLNGAVLKGSKIRIDKARPAKQFGTSEDMGETKKSKKEKKSSKDKSESSKKRKREDKDNVVDGVDLAERKVKRGWTETPTESAKRKKKERSDKKESKGSKDSEETKETKKDKEKKKRTKSKYTEQEECLLKVTVPANATGNMDKEDDPTKKKKRGKGNPREVTVHEFEKTTKFPSFLKDAAPDSSHANAEYVEGKGWVDEEGNLVEAVKEKKPKKVKKDAPKPKPKVVQPEPESDSDTSSSGTSSSGTSSSGSSSDEEEDEDEAVPVHKSVEYATPAKKNDEAPASSSPSSRNLTIKIPPPAGSPDDKVHPLEALYKRNKPSKDTTDTPAEEPEPFTFFGGGDDDEEEEEEEDAPPPMPMTPFTRQDFESRTLRSAAPTPDTAHPSRMANIWAAQEDEEMEDLEDLEDEDEEENDGQGADKSATTDFQAWFWQNRRDLNQSWMKRRKTVAKEKRHRENKARASKAV